MIHFKRGSLSKRTVTLSLLWKWYNRSFKTAQLFENNIPESHFEFWFKTWQWLISKPGSFWSSWASLKFWTFLNDSSIIKRGKGYYKTGQLSHYKTGQGILQKWRMCYKSGEGLLQNGGVITKRATKWLILLETKFCHLDFVISGNQMTKSTNEIKSIRRQSES